MKLVGTSRRKSFHSDLKERWSNFSLVEQMANTGAEIGRTINWKKKGNSQMVPMLCTEDLN